MKEVIIARRYARALADLAREREAIPAVREDLHKLMDLLDPGSGSVSVPELLDFLRSPTVPEKEKVRLTDVVCEKVRIGAIVSDFLNVLIRRHRIGLLRQIALEFARYAADYEGVWTATVETAQPLPEPDATALRERLVAAFSTEVRMETRVREDLLGGVRVRMHDTLIDGSLRNRLDQIESQLER